MKKILIITSAVILVLIGIRFSITKVGEIQRAKALALSSTPTVELGEVEEKEIYKSIEIPGRVQSMDKVDFSENGIIHKNVIDWLLNI